MTKISSLRLMALQNELESGNADALAIFWREIDKLGAPLVESIERDSDYSWVTFLWRAEKDIKNVIVLSQLDGSFFYVADKTLTRMLDTDLWYKTYRVRNDVRTTYRFSEDDSLVHLAVCRRENNASLVEHKVGPFSSES